MSFCFTWYLMVLIVAHAEGKVPINIEQHPRVKRSRLLLMSTNKWTSVPTPDTSVCTAGLRQKMQTQWPPLLCLTCENLSGFKGKRYMGESLQRGNINWLCKCKGTHH